MITDINSEDRLVQQTFAEHLEQALGWDNVYAFKAEPNFVDVVLQPKRLQLSLNLAFPEMSDPRGICKDFSGLGRWGDVEVDLTSLDELPYVMGLIRQSFKKQIRNGGDA